MISLVTAEPQTAVRRGGQAIVLSRDGASPTALARLLTDTGRGDSELTVLEQLGGPRERRRDGTARDWAADPPADVDDLNVIAVRYLPDERAVGSARRGVCQRRPDHQTGDAGGDVGGAGAAAGRAAVGCRRGIGQHRHRVVPQRIVAAGGGVRTRRAAPSQRSASTPRRIGVSIETRAARRRRRSTERRSAVGDLHRRRPDPARAAGRLPGAAARTVDGWSPTPSPRNPKPFSRRLFAARRPAATLPALSRRAGRRASPVGDPRRPVTQWHGDQAMTVYFIGAGPGAADLITVRGHGCSVAARYACTPGSIMPDDLLALCPPGRQGRSTPGR